MNDLNRITKDRAEKIKEGLINYRFEYLTSFKNEDDDPKYVWMSLSPSREYYIVETEESKTKYYKRFSDALNYFVKFQGDMETWIDLSYEQPENFPVGDDNIALDELDWIEKSDLYRA
jgi:hypothetical protein